MAGETFRCRTCGPLPLASFNQAVLKRGRSGECKSCRKRANALHYAANRWRLRAAVAPGVCGPEVDPKALAADVLSRVGRRCALTGISGKSLVVVKLADGGLVPILRKLFACGVAPGGVLAQTPPRLESPAPAPATPAPPASVAPDGDADTSAADDMNIADPLLSPLSPSPLEPSGLTSAGGASACAAPLSVSLLAERLNSMKETKRAIGGGLMTKGGVLVV